MAQSSAETLEAMKQRKNTQNIFVVLMFFMANLLSKKLSSLVSCSVSYVFNRAKKLLAHLVICSNAMAQ
jgi:hypothetical protein